MTGRRRDPLRGLSTFTLLAVTLFMGSSAPAQIVVVDNTDPGFTELSESWLAASGSGQYGDDYVYRSTSWPLAEVEWRPSIPEAGTYAVDVWYRTAVDRPSDAPYTVHYSGGTTTVPVDQRVNGGQWFPIGEFAFDAGTAGYVTLSTAAESGTTIVADAVRFRRTDVAATAAEVRACWLSHYTYLGKTDAALRQMAQNMVAGGINTVYFAVYSGQTVYWPSKAYQAAGGSWGSASTDYCARLSRIFREEGLKVGAWVEYGLALGYSSHPIAVAHPEWLARDAGGDPVTGENGGFVFITPGHADGTQLLVDMMRELAENYWFDDIQIDRFRWGRKSTGREYGYEDVTSDLYYATYGSYPPTNVNHTRWVGFREDLVNDVVQRCYDAIKAANPDIVVSTAPTGYYGIVQHMQRWSDWVGGGYIDLVLPQMYKTTFSAFVDEFQDQLGEVPAGHEHKLGVGYRASEDNDWTLVADQLNYARSYGVPHGCLWVYHQYTSQIAIQDELDNLPTADQPWQVPAYNPFVSPRLVQLFADDDDGAGRYAEYGGWLDSAQSGFYRFGSRIVAGGGDATATFGCPIPKSGRYEVYTWYTASSNRNDAAQYDITHYNGTASVAVDQRTGGGEWVLLGDWLFEVGDIAPRVVLSTAGSDAGEYTCADAIKLKLIEFALGDSDGDGVVTDADAATMLDCGLSGPNGAASADCTVYDFNDDGDTDLADLADFQRRLTTP